MANDHSGSRWITCHPHGDDGPGRPVLISGDGTVMGGMGGRFNGQKMGHLYDPSKGPKGVSPDEAHPHYNAHTARYADLGPELDTSVHGKPQYEDGAWTAHLRNTHLEAAARAGHTATAHGLLAPHPDGPGHGVLYYGPMDAHKGDHAGYEAFAKQMAEDSVGHVLDHLERQHNARLAAAPKAGTTPPNDDENDLGWPDPDGTDVAGAYEPSEADLRAYMEETQRETQRYGADHRKQIRDEIQDQGGISPPSQVRHGKRSTRGVSEYTALPSWCKPGRAKGGAGRGMAPDLMAEHLASMYPGLGITDETTLYDYLEQHERDRKGGYAPAGLREAVGIAPADGIDGDDGDAMLSTPLSEALSAEERDKLGDDQFAIPHARQLPMPDAQHARLAWSMLSRTEGLSHAEKRQAKARILAALERFGVDTADFDAHDDMRRHKDKDKDDAPRPPLTHDTHRTAGMREAFGDTSGGASDGGDDTMYNPPTKAKTNARAGLNWHDQTGHGDDDAVEMAHKIAGHARHEPLNDDDMDAIKAYHKGHKARPDASPNERRPSAGRVGYLLYGGAPMAAYANDPDHDGDTDTPGAPDNDASATSTGLTASTGGRAPLAEAALAEAALPASSVADAAATPHGDGSDGNDDRLDIQATGAMAPSALREAATNVVRHVDRTHRDMEVRIISPGFGASRHGGLPVYYTEAALKPAAPKFKGLKCYLNHPTATERRERPERDVTKWAATMRESWWDPQTNEVRGVMRAYDPWLIDRAAAAPDELALSIDTKGMVAHGTVGGRKAAIVESIDTFGSVDIVTEPGARGGVVRLLESRRVALDDPTAVASGAGGDNATDQDTDNDTARVVFSEAERHEVRTEMLEQVTLTDLREARGDIVAEIERVAAEKAAEKATKDTEARVRAELREAADHDKQTALSVETARQTDLIEAMCKEYEDRLYTMERDLNVRDTRTLVERAVGATALPEAAERRVLAQFTEATCGFGEYATFATPEDLTAQVQAAAEAEKAYIKSVAGPTSVIRGMGAASTGTPTGLTEATSGPLVALREANARLDGYIAKVPTGRASAMGGQGAPVIETPVGTGTVGQVAAAATKRLDAILGAA